MPGMPFIPEGIKPLKNVSPLLPQNDAFLQAGVVASLPGSFGEYGVQDVPPPPLDAFRQHSPVLTSSIHDQTVPDT